MSKIGKRPIKIPEGVKVEVKDNKVSVTGPKGVLLKELPPEIFIEKKDNQLLVKLKEPREKKALWGSWRAHLKNMLEGVTKGFEKKLKIEGLGWRATLEGKDLVLQVGFTHPVKISPLEGINFSVKKDIIKVSGIDKEKVGTVAAKIRKVKPPEPYKGKGIRYLDEIIRKKPGKKAIAVAK